MVNRTKKKKKDLNVEDTLRRVQLPEVAITYLKIQDGCERKRLIPFLEPFVPISGFSFNLLVLSLLLLTKSIRFSVPTLQ